MNGSGTITSEKQTGRVHLATRENLQVRTRSPVKSSVGDGIEDGKVKERILARQGSRPVEGQAQYSMKERKAPCGCLLSNAVSIEPSR